MRFFSVLVCIWVASLATAMAAPSAMSFTTDAPGNTGSLYFVRSSYVAADKYPGAITLTVTDSAINWATVYAAATNGSNSPFWFYRYDATVTTPTSNAQLGNAAGSDRLLYGTHITSVTSLGGNQYSFVIKYSGKGANGAQLVVVYEPTADKIVSSNFAFIDGTAPGSPIITAPVASSNQINYVGRASSYSLTASANYSNNSSYFLTTSTLASGNTDTYSVEFYVSSLSSASWNTSATLVASQIISSSTATATANFVSSNVRLPYIGAISYDSAGNPTVGTVSSANLLETKWLALGKIKDDHNNTWYGDSTFAGNWQSSDNLTAGANVSVQFYAVNYYGDLNSSFSALGNVEMASALSNVPQNGFNGSVPDLQIGSANATNFSGNGIVTYGGCVNLYRQENVKLGNQHSSGTLWTVDSPLIAVKHNLVNDVVFVSSGNFSSSTVDSSGNGISGNLSTFTNAVAGTPYGLRVAIVDRYLNLCNTTGFGRSDNVTLGSNAHDPMTTASNINGYLTYGASSNLNYTMSYPGAYTWSSNGSAGLIDITNTFYVEESGNVQLTNTTAAGVSADNVQNNTARITVEKATSKVVYFDGSNNYRFSGNLEGNFFAAGNAMTVYAHITDLYGNHYTTDTSSVTISANTASGNGYVQRAYRNDSTTYYNTQSNPLNAVAGIVSIPLRFDRATTSGNSTYFPYTNLGLKAVLAGSAYMSESLGVLPQVKSNVYIANAAGEPISSANNLGTAHNMTSGNAVVGTEIRIAGAIGDNYGNVDLSATDTVRLNYTSLSTSPNNTAPFSTAGNTRAAIAGVVIADNRLGATAVKQENTKSLSLQVTGLISESTVPFNVDAGIVTKVDFVTSTGLYAAANIMNNNTAGNTFAVYAAGMDAYYNTNAHYTGANIIVSSSSTNTIDISPAGNAATYTQGTSTSGYTTYNVTIFDAKTGVKLKATDGTYSANSTAFTIAANTSNPFVLRFVDSASLDNDTLTSSSNRILTSSNTMTSGYAGNAMTFYGAELDQFGNSSTRTGANITLASHTTSASNITYASLKTTGGGNSVTFAGQLTTSGVASFSQAFYVAETNKMVKLQDTVGSSNTANFSPVFSILPNRPSLTLFTDSTGIWAGATGSSLTFTSGNVIPSSNLGLNVAMTNLYVGFYDFFGNSTSTNVTGSVNIGVYADSTGAYYAAGANVGITGGNLSTTNNSVYFDPNISSKAVSVAAAGNYMLKIGAASLAPTIVAGGNLGRFAVQDMTPPSVTVVTPNGGEKMYSGAWPVSFTVADTAIAGSYTPYVSYDSGTTWSTSGAPSAGTLGGTTTETISWSISSNVNSDRVRIKILVTDSTGNVAEDSSNADFSISPSTAAIAYVLGDTANNAVKVNFREAVYSSTGSALGASAFSLTTLSLGSGSNVSHTAGASTSTLTLSANLSATDFNSTPAVGLKSGNVSKNSSGASSYTSTSEIASSAIRQLVVTPYASVRSKMASSDNQRLFGLKLTGWTSNTELKQINIKIDAVGGVVTASDFASGSASSASSGLALLDSSGNVISLTSAPVMVIGDTISLNCSNTLSTNALTGSSNFNFYLSVATSSTISDVVPDSFKVSVQSVMITDATTGSNVYKVYQPYGTTTTDPIVADVTAPAAPLLSIASSVNSANVSAVALSLQFEANAVAHYTYTNGAVSIGNSITKSGNGLVAATVLDNLSTLADGTVTLRAYAIDAIGNNGNTQNLISTTTFVLDRDPIRSANVAVSMSNITSVNKNAVNTTLTLSGSNDSGASYRVIFYDANGGSSTAYVGSLASTANVVTLTGLDLSGLADTTAFTANVSLTDNRGNSTSEFTAKTVTKDTVGPTLGALSVNDSVINLAESLTGLTLSTASITESCTVTYVLTDSLGVKVSGNVSKTADVAVTQIATGISLALADGTILITAYGTDANGNQGASVSTSVMLDRTPSLAPVLLAPISNAVTSKMPTLRWESVSGANSYEIVVMNSASATVYSANVTSTSNVITSLSAGSYTWKVRTTDNFGNIGSYSSSESFVVKIPVLSYVVGELDSPNAIAVFDQEVFSNVNATGALAVPNFTVTGIKGVSLVTHNAGDQKVGISFSSTFNAANVNVATLSPESVYGDGGNAAATTGIAIRQLEVKDKVVSSSALVYGGSAQTVARINAKGWTGNTVKVVAVDYTVVPVNGSLESADFSGNVSVAGNVGITTGTFGSNQTLTFTSPVTLASDNAMVFDLQLQAAASNSVAMNSAKVARLKVNKLLVSIDGTVVARQLAGTTTTSDLSLTNVSFTTTKSTGSANLAFTVGQTITVVAGNVSSMASYMWTQTSGNAVSLMPSANTLSFVPSEAGQFGFKLAYSLDGYSIDLFMSSNVTINSAKNAGVLGMLSNSASSFASQADFDQGFSALSTLVGGVSGQENAIVLASSGLVSQILNTPSIKVTTAQVTALLDVMEEAVTAGVSASSVNAGVLLLNNVKSLPAVNATQVQQAYKTLLGLNKTSPLAESAYLAVNVDLAKFALKSLAKTGGKTMTADISAGVKSVVERLLQGETNTLSLSGASKLTVTIDKTTLAGLAGTSDNVAIYAVKLPVSDNILVGSSNLVVASSVYEISLAGFNSTTGAFSDVPFKTGTNNSTSKKLVMTMNVNNVIPGKEYKVVYRESPNDANWTILDGSVTQPNSSGMVSFTTTHLTQFAVVESETPVATTGSSGGGCLLK